MHEFVALCTRAITNELTAVGAGVAFISVAGTKLPLFFGRRCSKPQQSRHVNTFAYGLFNVVFRPGRKNKKTDSKYPGPSPPHSGPLFYVRCSSLTGRRPQNHRHILRSVTDRLPFRQNPMGLPTIIQTVCTQYSSVTGVRGSL